MGDVIAVDILNSVDDLLEIEFSLLLGDALALDVVEELAVVGQLHDDEDIVVSIQDLVELDNVGVVDELEDPDFSLDLRSSGLYFGDHVFILHVLLIDDLDCYFDVGEVVLGH